MGDSLGNPTNLFWIPNSPIKELVHQAESNTIVGQVVQKPPRFLGFGRQGGLSRFTDFIPGCRDRNFVHPSRFGDHPGRSTRCEYILHVNLRGEVFALIRSNNLSDKHSEVEYIGNYVISGTTRDGTGTPIGGVTVDLFQTANDVWKGTAVSDGSGLFSIPVFTADSNAYYLVAYKSGTPDISGTTINTIQAVKP